LGDAIEVPWSRTRVSGERWRALFQIFAIGRNGFVQLVQILRSAASPLRLHPQLLPFIDSFLSANAQPLCGAQGLSECKFWVRPNDVKTVEFIDLSICKSIAFCTAGCLAQTLNSLLRHNRSARRKLSSEFATALGVGARDVTRCVTDQASETKEFQK